VVYCSNSFPDRNYELSPIIESTYHTLNANPLVRRGLDIIKADDERTLKDQIAICEIPAPTFREEVRAEYYMHQLTTSITCIN